MAETRGLVLRTIVFTVVAPGLIAGVIPALVRGRAPLATPPFIAGGIALAIPSIALFIACAAAFVLRGRGTPNPADPPRALVTTGPFAYCRNPMYVAVVGAIAAQAVAFASWATVLDAALTLLLFHMRVIWYEEPVLSRDFGEEFRQYRQAVPRWIPRLRATRLAR
jgi:protein-S-isoprenylcysteine O-methyltransferase Ste14